MRKDSNLAYVSACNNHRAEPFPVRLQTVGQTAKAWGLARKTIYEDIEHNHKDDRQGVYRFGRGGIRINPFVYLHWRRLPVDAVADARLVEVTSFLLPFLLALKTALDNLIEQLLAARSASLFRIDEADNSNNGQKE